MKRASGPGQGRPGLPLPSVRLCLSASRPVSLLGLRQAPPSFCAGNPAAAAGADGPAAQAARDELALLDLTLRLVRARLWDRRGVFFLQFFAPPGELFEGGRGRGAGRRGAELRRALVRALVTNNAMEAGGASAGGPTEPQWAPIGATGAFSALTNFALRSRGGPVCCVFPRPTAAPDRHKKMLAHLRAGRLCSGAAPSSNFPRALLGRYDFLPPALAARVIRCAFQRDVMSNLHQ